LIAALEKSQKPIVKAQKRERRGIRGAGQKAKQGASRRGKKKKGDLLGGQGKSGLKKKFAQTQKETMKGSKGSCIQMTTMSPGESTTTSKRCHESAAGAQELCLPSGKKGCVEPPAGRDGRPAYVRHPEGLLFLPS